jgi:hypothetical protein
MKRLVARLSFALLGGVALLALGPVSPALAVPVQATLHLAGIHPADVEPHEGTFTASVPLCASGSWLGSGGGTRVFTCKDGTGTFKANFAGEFEHTTGAVGPWTISGGTGNYAAVRGKGMATTDFSTGEKTSPITFNTTWSGIIDFDATAPTGSITKVKIVRSSKPPGKWTVRVSFSARDNEESSPVTFSATATAAGSLLSSRTGPITAGTGSFTVAFRPGKRLRLLRVEIELIDQWANVTTIKKTIRLR